MLADVVRTDRHNHRKAAGDSEEAPKPIKALARAHQSAIWSRQREKNALRNALMDYYPGALNAFGTDLDEATPSKCWRSLQHQPWVERSRWRRSHQPFAAVGRQRNLERTAKKIQAALREEQMT